jgi:cell division septum initiation protein DivIVA
MEPNDAPSSSARAHELRASLGARREVEALLAEASATREAAVADADAIIEEAQQVSEQLLHESRAEAERVTTDARHRADGVVARARSEAEDITRQARAAADAVRARAEAQVEEHRRRVRAELTEQVTREVAEQSRRELARVHERQQAMIGDLEASVRIMGVSMEAAVANIGEMLSALDSLRAHTAESLGDPAAPFTAPPRHAEPLDHLIRATTARAAEPDTGHGQDTGSDTWVGGAGADDGDGQQDDESDDADGSGGATARRELPPDATYAADDLLSADELGDVVGHDDLEHLDDDDDLSDGAGRPLTATEAFLLTAHVDHDDPPLPPMDDADIGARYARDAMRATARARSRRDAETFEVGPETSGRRRNGRDEREGHPADAQSDEGDERVETAQGDESHDPTDTAGKPLGWLFRSSS